MRLIFAGTPAFAAVALEALMAAGHQTMLVLTQPDRPAGRGLKPTPSNVKIIAQKHGLIIEQPLTLKNPAALELVASVRADAMVVAAYGLILPKAILAMPRLGCLNIHASLLPRWRGAAPIQRAILAGDTETGVTIMQMDEGLDTGDMLLKRALPISADETAGELHDRLAALGAQLIVEALGALPVPVRQDAALATYAAKISKAEAIVDWRDDAATIARKVRAYNPFPGALCALDGERVKLWRARVACGDAGAPATPGTVCAAEPGKLVIACGRGTLEILELQRAGGKRLPAAAFLAGHAIAPGAQFT
jgi:methionyl-tRNA formyltransferase